MIKEAIVKIVNKEDLTFDEAYAVMNEIMNGETSPTQNAAFLAALSTKSAKAETTQEIAGCAMAMREHATAVDTDFDLFEIVGTGGDNAGSFNISTTIFRGHQGFTRFLDNFFQNLVFAFVQQLGDIRSIGIATFARIDDVLNLGKDSIGHGRFLLFSFRRP